MIKKALGDGIRRILNDAELRRRLSTAGRNCVEKNYNINDNIRKHDALFRGLCLNKRKSLMVRKEAFTKVEP